MRGNSLIQDGAHLLLFCLLSATAAWPQAAAHALRAEMAHDLGRRGAAVVLRVSDGKILAAYNEDVLGRRLAAPGSAVKPFILLRLLEQGLLQPEETIACHRALSIGGHHLACSHPRELTRFAAEDALAFSCNSYFVTVAARLRSGEIEKLYRELGFTRPTGRLASEAAGRVVEARTQEDRELLAVGVSGVEVTPMELAMAYLRLAKIDPAHASAAQTVVLHALKSAVIYGLANGAAVDGLSVAGKTGTAADATGRRTHAWFAGFAPAEKPEVVVMVFVEGGSGGEDAAPVAQRILRAWKAGLR